MHLQPAAFPAGAGGVHSSHPVQHLRAAKDVPTQARWPRARPGATRVTRTHSLHTRQTGEPDLDLKSLLYLFLVLSRHPITTQLTDVLAKLHLTAFTSACQHLDSQSTHVAFRVHLCFIFLRFFLPLRWTFVNSDSALTAAVTQKVLASYFEKKERKNVVF